MSQCTAHSKRTGERCKAQAMHGATVCYHHGGKSLKGVESPTFKHGKYSRYLPDRLAERYQEALNDPELLAFREEIALIDSRLKDAIEELDRNESGAIWRNLQAAAKEYRKAVVSQDKDDAGRMIDSMLYLIEEGSTQAQMWHDILELVEHRRKAVESERKRYVEMQQVLTSERVMVLAASILALIRDNVKDTKQMRTLISGIRGLLE